MGPNYFFWRVSGVVGWIGLPGSFQVDHKKAKKKFFDIFYDFSFFNVFFILYVVISYDIDEAILAVLSCEIFSP